MNIITRAEWGARPFVRPRWSVPLSSRKFFVVHYPGAGTPPADVVAYAKWIERIHMDQNGWSGVGYNYFISHGQIAEGCGRDIVGSHSPPHNVDGLGINIWTSHGIPLDEDLALARELYDQLNRQKGGDPLRKWYHGKDYPTECPGPNLRAWVNAGMNSPAGSTQPGPAPTDWLDMVTENELRKIIREEVRNGTPRAEMKSHASLDGGVIEENVAGALRRIQTIGRQNRVKQNQALAKLNRIIDTLKEQPEAARGLRAVVLDVQNEVAAMSADDEAEERAEAETIVDQED